MAVNQFKQSPPIHEQFLINGLVSKAWANWFLKIFKIVKSGTLGDFFGPDSSTDSAIVLFDGTTGKLGKNSVVTIDASGNTTGQNDLSMTGNLTGLNDLTMNGDLTVNTSTFVVDVSNNLTITPSGGIIKLPAGMQYKTATKITNHTVLKTDYYLVMDGSSASVRFTMPASPDNAEVHKVSCEDDTNACDIDFNGNTFYGDASIFTVYQGESYEFFYDGTEWKAI